MGAPLTTTLRVLLTLALGHGEAVPVQLLQRVMLALPAPFASRWNHPSNFSLVAWQPTRSPPPPPHAHTSSTMTNEREIVLLTRLLGLTTRSLERALRRVRTLRHEQSTHRWPIYIAVLHLLFLGPFWVYLVLDGHTFAIPWIVLLFMALGAIYSSYMKTKIHLADTEREAEALVIDGKSLMAMLWPTWTMQRMADLGLKEQVKMLEMQLADAALVLGPGVFDAMNLVDSETYRKAAVDHAERDRVLS